MPGLQVDGPRFLQNTSEVILPVEIKFSGNIPEWLNGTMLSSGPGVFDLEKGSVKHWMDGYAIISKFEIDGNSVNFSSKYLQSTSYKKALQAQKPVVPEFGTPPGEDSSRGFFSKLLPAFTPNDLTDNCMGQIVRVGASIYAIGDSPYLHRIDPHTLNTVETNHCKSFGVTAFSPSQIKDRDGDTYMLGVVVQPTFRYSVMKMPAENENQNLDKKFESICTFSSRWKFGACGLRNSFAVTENYIVFIEVPAVINLLKLAATFVRGYCAIDWLDWRPQDKPRFCLINKLTTKVVSTEVYADSAFVVAEFVNAYEENDQVVVDLFTMADMTIFKASMLNMYRTSESMENYKPGEYRRYVLPVISDLKSCPEGKSLLSESTSNNLVSASAKRMGDRIILSPELIREKDSGFDNGVINPNYKGRRHSFVYVKSNLASSFIPSSLAHQIAKVDVNRREILTWELTPGQFPAEPVFVPNPTGTDEDDGVLLVLIKIMFSYEEKDFLVALDPKTMTEIGRAEFNCPVGLGYRYTFIKS